MQRLGRSIACRTAHPTRGALFVLYYDNKKKTRLGAS